MNATAAPKAPTSGVPVAEADALYPAREADAARLAKVGIAPDVAARVQDYLLALNASDAAHAVSSQSPFDRSYFFEVDEQPRNVKFVRLVSRYARSTNIRDRRVAAFVEVSTGLVYKDAGFKRPAPGPRFSLATDEGRDRIVAVADPYGSHLYARR